MLKRGSEWRSWETHIRKRGLHVVANDAHTFGKCLLETTVLRSEQSLPYRQ